MIWGALGVLNQQNIKRFMAYSSIGHMGFLMIGLSMLSDTGIKGSVVYMIFYALMTLGFFGALLYMARHGKNVQTLSDLNGLGRTYPAIAFVLGFMIFSMAGIPPLPGFLPKLFVLRAAINHNAYFLCCVAVVYSVLAAAYYLVMLKAIFMDTPQPSTVTNSVVGHNRTFLSMFLVLTGIVIALTCLLIAPDFLLKYVSEAVTELVY
jgi:NADH-quinone oxidoreductase subunit N